MSHLSQQAIPKCAAGLTSADLSAWRDDALPADEAARIGAHSPACPACQDRLRGFETIAVALNGQHTPIPDERLWRSIVAALSAHERQPSDAMISRETTISDPSAETTPTPPLRRLSTRRRRALGTLAAVAAIALVVVGFGRLFQLGAGTRQTQAFAVQWRQVTLPGGMDKQLSAGALLSVFPNDGEIAWLCQSGTKIAPGPLHVWRTHDGGATWQTLSVAQIDKAIACQVSLDQLDPDVATLNVGYISQTTPAQVTGANYSTLDGGASWQAAPLIMPMTDFATLNGATYAIRQDGTDANRLAVSKDGLQTWNYVDDPIQAQKLMASHFWLNPNTGGLLVLAISMAGNGLTSLWTADTSGGAWKQLTVSAQGAVVARPTSDGQHWNICVLAASTGGSQPAHYPPSPSLCATDQSNAWLQMPGLNFRHGVNTATPGVTPDDNLYGNVALAGIANDGALLASAEDRFNADGQPTRVSLYRLPTGATQWQNSGALPFSAANAGVSGIVTYAPRPGGGMLWAMPDESPGNQEPLGSVYTASYPGPAAPPLPTQPQQTPTQTGNVDQAAPLEWQPIANPTGFQPRLVTTNILAIAPSDGQTAYACAQPNLNPPATQPLAWVTRNGGATWSALALPQVNGRCWLLVDEVNPRDVLLGISNNPPAGSTPLGDVYYRSVDGGATWQRVSSLDGSAIYQFASYHSAVYALRDTTPNSTTDYAHVQVSTDGMISWKTIDGAFFSSHTSASQFWLNPYNGALLAANIPAPVDGIPLSTAATALVWHSGDGGAHWSSLGTPQLPAGGESSVFVQPPQANHPWGICVADFTASPVAGGTASNLLYCGDDSGQSWHDMPTLDVGDPAGVVHYAAYTSDGAILALDAATTSSGALTYNVFRLPAGASRWQGLGPTPEFSLLYAPATGSDGVLWSLPENGVLTDTQGRIFRVGAP